MFIDENDELYDKKGVNDSIWNFHVWNEGYFRRPDLPKGRVSRTSNVDALKMIDFTLHYYKILIRLWRKNAYRSFSLEKFLMVLLYDSALC